MDGLFLVSAVCVPLLDQSGLQLLDVLQCLLGVTGAFCELVHVIIRDHDQLEFVAVIFLLGKERHIGGQPFEYALRDV